MVENVESKAALLVKWLCIMMYAATANIINTVLNPLPFMPAAVTTWLGRIVMVIMILCMFRLAPVSKRYQTAGILRTVTLICTLIGTYWLASGLLTLAASILSIIAVYQEYTAHSELVADKDNKLSHKWHSLFIWGIVSGILVGLGSIVAVLIATFAGLDVVNITAILIGILSIPQFIIDVVYLLYLKKMRIIFAVDTMQV